MSTPVSKTATITEDLPLVIVQASGAIISCKYHCLLKYGSLAAKTVVLIMNVNKTKITTSLLLTINLLISYLLVS